MIFKKIALLPVLLASAASLTGGHLFADARLPGFFDDHMVLQQEKEIRVWGWADAGESISVTLADQSATATTDNTGRWQVTLPAMKASKTPHTLQVKAANTIHVKDVLIGEVWLCSGQSNMEWTVASSTNAKEEIAAAIYPLIRQIKVSHQSSMVPQDDIDADWQICSPQTAGQFTACGYFMARELHQELDVPIGLINSSWGGTRVEPWTPPVGFQKVDALQDIYRSVLGRTPGTDAYVQTLTKHIADVQKWLDEANQSVDTGQTLAPSPTYPAELTAFKSHQDPTMLYNAMIHALVGYPIRGVIWYQGESNHTDGMLYTEKKKALINGWRELWNQGDFPFYYVQIAPFQYGNEDPTILGQFWEAQAAVMQIPNTAMVVINDIATLNNIHPPNKQDVGHRLALLALKNDYGRDHIVAQSPQLESTHVQDGQLELKFKNSGGGLKTRDGAAATHFEVIGPGSHGYQAAKATIDGDKVILTSDKVANPVAFRFAWHKLAQPNLTGKTGLPVGAVRGGTEPDFESLLSIDTDYQLVYDLDLHKLQHSITYDVDHSSKVGAFDRVGYLLQLRSSDLGDQSVFVSMDAFTDDAKKIGIPTADSGASFQQTVSNMDVYSTVTGVVTGTGIDAGNIEFWPNNYAPNNGRGIQGASNTHFDFGDDPGPPRDGYGSMQVHNYGAKQTIFAINQWKRGGAADLGIGNSPGEQRDWTFTSSGPNYSKKRLRVYVRPK
ncbi:MAG: 9-O-acetylesterase [Pirellulaceae bacterium]|nr:9-O-acetylesterase [Pirellulaceae bacterium]